MLFGVTVSTDVGGVEDMRWNNIKRFETAAGAAGRVPYGHTPDQEQRQEV